MARALANDPINQLEENLQCTVCLEVLTDPKTLPCCHSFCKDCLERIVETCRGKAPRGQPIREFPCPYCRATFILDPDKHVADMPRNHFICNMVTMAAVLDRGTRVPCSHNCSQSYSVARCVTCEKFLCRECLTAHNNYRANNGHSVLTMEELSKPENRKKINDKMYCNEHSGKKLKVYCETCDQLICRDCMDFKHVKQGHSCVLVKDVANNYKRLLASNNKIMDEALTKGNAFLQQLTLTTEQFDRDAENVRIQIAQKKDTVLKTVTEMLEQKTKTLLKKVDDIRKAEREKFGKQAEKAKLYVEKIKTSVQLSKMLVDKGTEEEIISNHKIIMDNAKSLLTDRKKYFEAPIPDVNVSYNSSTSDEPISKDTLLKLAKSLGEVHEEKKDADLKFASMDYGTPETAAGIKEKGANAIIQTIERKHRCGIAVVTKEETDVRRSFRTSPTSPVHNLNDNRERTMQCRYKYPNGKIIEIHQGDILNHAVYYLVNPANEEMKHSGGLARAIVEKGGKKIQTDCARALQDQGRDRLMPGNVITTDSGGNLNCKKILHVVVPKHRDTPSGDEAREEMYLRHCCNNVLKDATNGQTIALPVLGTGSRNIPHDISAKSLVCAAHEFLQEHPTHPLREVHFVDNNPPAIEALMKEMTTRFAHDPNFHINELVLDRWRPYLRAARVAPSSGHVVFVPRAKTKPINFGSRFSAKDKKKSSGLRKVTGLQTAFPLPANWEYQPIDSSTRKELVVHSVNIDTPETVDEYNKIHDMFTASVTTATLPNVQVVKIERIQNPRLYQIYEGQKKKMINDGNEIRLFHGTAKTSLDAINTNGFTRAYCGRNAVRLGKGSYFATQAWYYARKNYSTPDENGLKYMYIARVLVGKYTKGKEGLLVPPPIDESNQLHRYDSVVDDVAKPTMFVIFYDYQSYPEYLITFKS